MSKEARAAVEYLEDRYDDLDLDPDGWRRVSIRTAYLFNFREDMRDSCLKHDGAMCHKHVGEASHGSVDPAAYGYGTYVDRYYDVDMPRYNIPLDDDAWKDGHP